MANFLPFNSIDGDRAIKAEDWAWYFGAIVANGVFPTPTTGLQVMATSGMKVEVKAGKGFINGYAFKQDSDKVFTLPTANGMLPRIDRVVLRWDLAGRQMLIDILVGVPSASPTAPLLTRTTEVYELGLADIYVAKGAIEVTINNITDTRYNSALCGIVTGAIDQFDFSALTTQFDAWYASFKAQVIAEYSSYANAVNTAITKSTTATSNANTAADAANAAAESANKAAAAVYTDRDFLLLKNDDGSLSLTYNGEE